MEKVAWRIYFDTLYTFIRNLREDIGNPGNVNN